MAPRIPAERAPLLSLLGVSRRRARARHIRERDEGKGERSGPTFPAGSLGERVRRGGVGESRARSPCDTWSNCLLSSSTPPPPLGQDFQAEFDSRPDTDGAARSGACVPSPDRSSFRARSSHRYTCMLHHVVDVNVMAGRWRGVFPAHGRDATLYGAKRHSMSSRSPPERRLSAPHSHKTQPCLLTVNMFFTSHPITTITTPQPPTPAGEKWPRRATDERRRSARARPPPPLHRWAGKQTL